MKNFDIIVVGAGISGLSAARLFKKNGYSVAVLEARDCIGGRIQTIQSTNGNIELGGGWIHGIENNPLYHLIKRIGLETKSFDLYSDIKLFNKHGKKLSHAETNLYLKQYEIILKKISHLSRVNNGKKLSIKEALSSVLASVDINLPYFDNWLKYCLTCYEGQDIELVQLISTFEYIEFSGEHHILPNGFSELINYLANTLIIYKSDPVISIEQSDEYIYVKTQNKNYKSKQVVISVPVSILKTNKIKFYPEISLEKQYSINTLGVGILNKIIIHFPYHQVFDELDSFHILTDATNIPIIFMKNNSNKNSCTYIAYISGTLALNISNINQQSIRALIQLALKNIINSNLVDLARIEITEWGQEPFIKGSYTYIPAGKSIDLCKSLAKSEVKLHFIGEATSSKHYATIHGALISAIDKVSEITNNKHTVFNLL